MLAVLYVVCFFVEEVQHVVFCLIYNKKIYLFGKRVRKKCFCIEPDGDWVEFTIQFLKYCLKSQLWKVLRGWYPLH